MAADVISRLSLIPHQELKEKKNSTNFLSLGDVWELHADGRWLMVHL
jgi:hypothetical protein